MDCSFKNLTYYPKWNFEDIEYDYEQIFVNFTGNNLSVGPLKNKSLFDNVTRLDLSANLIQEMYWLPSDVEVIGTVYCFT